MEYEVGEVVMLKSGTYLMSVVGIVEDVVHCQWLNYRDEKHEDEFSVQLLFSPKKTNLFLDYDQPADTFFSNYDCPSKNRGYYALHFDQYDNNEIHVGSVVKFSSYYTFMTVESIKDEHNIICVWFNKFGYLKREIFDIRTLSIYDFKNKESYQCICTGDCFPEEEFVS